jgi:DNA replication protein DnaC
MSTTTLTEAVGEVMPHVPELTEEQWEKHDRKVGDEREAQEREARKAALEHKRQALMERGLSKLILNQLFGNPDNHKQTPAVEAVDQWPSREGAIWCLSGNVGCGKTFAAHKWLVGSEIELAIIRDVRMVTAAWFARQSRYSSDKFELCGEVPLLVMDDLGAEYADANDSFVADLDELLNMRWTRGLQTLITTNLIKETFRKRYGNRIVDRIRQYGGWVEVKHPSLRGDAAHS